VRSHWLMASGTTDWSRLTKGLTIMKKIARRIAATTVASGILAAGAVGLAGAASASTVQAHGGNATSYRFQTLDNAKDLTFNQLLGINDFGVIAGYFGSGMAGHPNKGYVLLPNHKTYINENFPGSVQTQVTGLNNNGVTVGFWAPTNLGTGDANHGFVEAGGRFRTADDPAASAAGTTVDQLLGVNDADVAVGFYTDANGNTHGYEYNIAANRFSTVTDPAAPSASLTAAAINDRGDVAGFYANPANGTTDGFLLSHGRFTDLAVPGAASTTALGVSGSDEVVGFYTDAAGNMHGFTWTQQHGFATVDDPQGVGTTTINGVNDFGQLVGFYVDGAGNTDGFLATPQR
jgi:hypothetical protein